jgi:hypothetical protein
MYYAADVPARLADHRLITAHQTSATEETTMNRKIAFTALSLAIVLGGASGAVAGSKKPHDARQAYGAEISGGQVSDPRHAPQGGNHPTWCDTDPQCNGWALWMQEINAGKIKY